MSISSFTSTAERASYFLRSVTATPGIHSLQVTMPTLPLSRDAVMQPGYCETGANEVEIRALLIRVLVILRWPLPRPPTPVWREANSTVAFGLRLFWGSMALCT